MLEVTVKHEGEQWKAKVARLEKRDGIYEVYIKSRSGIHFILGEYSGGWFVCLPGWDYGTGLSSDLSDVFYNYEKMRSGLGDVDARTVAVALKEIGKLVSKKE
ncbi:MAG: hypothetical protein HPY74_18520 [Firmicutes bacterium]|nr:hypothetical protein [Bacillota bacterium]